MEYCYSFVCLMLASFCWYADSNKINTLTRLVQKIASRQDLESATILEKFNSLELQLNESQNSFQCINPGQPENNPSSTSENEANDGKMVRILKAFKEEKKVIKTLQRQMPEINKTVEGFDKMLGNFTNVVEEIVGEMCTPVDLEPLKKELTEKLDKLSEPLSIIAKMEELFNPVKKEFTEKINKLSEPLSIITKMEEKLNKLSEAVQSLSATVDEIAGSGKTTAITTMDMTENTVKPTSRTFEKMDSCLSHYKEGRTDNGVYTVYPLEDNNPIKVSCDMTTDGGGWTVFQRREDGSVDFYRDWQDYKQGFGTLTGEFWLGNDNIAALTSTGSHELRVDLEDFDGVRTYAKYGTFKVLPESDNYRLEVSRFSGDAGDSLKDRHNGMAFTTKDRDNDKGGRYSCAQRFKGGWWYRNCHHANLNGLYLKGPNSLKYEGVIWFHWRGWEYSLKMTEMKLR